MGIKVLNNEDVGLEKKFEKMFKKYNTNYHLIFTDKTKYMIENNLQEFEDEDLIMPIKLILLTFLKAEFQKVFGELNIGRFTYDEYNSEYFKNCLFLFNENVFIKFRLFIYADSQFMENGNLSLYINDGIKNDDFLKGVRNVIDNKFPNFIQENFGTNLSGYNIDEYEEYKSSTKKIIKSFKTYYNYNYLLLDNDSLFHRMDGDVYDIFSNKLEKLFSDSPIFKREELKYGNYFNIDDSDVNKGNVFWIYKGNMVARLSYLTNNVDVSIYIDDNNFDIENIKIFKAYIDLKLYNFKIELSKLSKLYSSINILTSDDNSNFYLTIPRI